MLSEDNSLVDRIARMAAAVRQHIAKLPLGARPSLQELSRAGVLTKGDLFFMVDNNIHYLTSLSGAATSFPVFEFIGDGGAMGFARPPTQVKGRTCRISEAPGILERRLAAGVSGSTVIQLTATDNILVRMNELWFMLKSAAWVSESDRIQAQAEQMGAEVNVIKRDGGRVGLFVRLGGEGIPAATAVPAILQGLGLPPEMEVTLVTG